MDAVRKILVKCSLPVSEYNPDTEIVLRDISLDFRSTKEVVILEYENGIQIPFSELPAGYLRLFSMVLDIACRGYLLNKNCNPTGIVLIDGLDLHLHPSVERTILKRLRTTFTHTFNGLFPHIHRLSLQPLSKRTEVMLSTKFQRLELTLFLRR